VWILLAEEHAGNVEEGLELHCISIHDPTNWIAIQFRVHADSSVHGELKMTGGGFGPPGSSAAPTRYFFYFGFLIKIREMNPAKKNSNLALLSRASVIDASHCHVD
jgi:hypothetical protein